MKKYIYCFIIISFTLLLAKEKSEPKTEKISLKEMHVKLTEVIKKGGLEPFVAELAAEDFRTRKAAYKKIETLTAEQKVELYEIIISSKDPELKLLAKKIATIYKSTILKVNAAYSKYPSFAGLAPGSKEAQEKQRELSKKMPLEIKLKKSGIHLRLIPADKSKKIMQPFYIGKFEITQEQWQKVMGNNPSKFANKKSPVEQISWKDCQLFIKKLSELENLSNNLKLSLPKSTQWQFACRAGTSTNHYTGSTEEDLARAAWYSKKEKPTKPQGIGQKVPNAFGLYDMHGNVWEWCDDSTTDDSYRIFCGGGWLSSPKYCLPSSQLKRTPTFRYNYLGLRITLNIK